MQNAVQSSMSFSATTVQTILFKGDDEQWLGCNLDAGRELLTGLAANPRHQLRHNWLITDVEVDVIYAFLSKYRVHEDQQEFVTSLVVDYIRAQQAFNHLTRWNVAVIGRRDADLGTIDLGLGINVPLVNRSRFMRGNPAVTDIKALISELDVIADIDSPENARAMKRSALLAEREQVWGNNGLLLLYPIHKDSEPLGKPPHPLRRPLAARDHVLGVSMVFPQSPNPTKHKYVTVSLGSIPEPDPDVPMEMDEE